MHLYYSSSNIATNLVGSKVHHRQGASHLQKGPLICQCMISCRYPKDQQVWDLLQQWPISAQWHTWQHEHVSEQVKWHKMEGTYSSFKLPHPPTVIDLVVVDGISSPDNSINIPAMLYHKF